jgi:GH24 family phage-related lysozyme (muramidase)
MFMKSFKQYIQEKNMATAALAGIVGGVALGLSNKPPDTQQQPVQQTTVSAQNTEQETVKQEKPKLPAWHSLISGSEGMRTDAYWDSTGKVWTIGKGSTTHPDGRPVREGDTITPDQANQYMEHYVNKNLVPKLEKIPTWGKMNDNQRGALISFGYNVGPNFYGSKGFETISKALSSEQTLTGVPGALKLYNKSGGKVLRGLQTRREAEGTLWNTPVN